ncbi:MAG: NAD(P)H-dependent glycerol-3-phosphate dehydrogenase [Saprospiraceae bacterium]|jgi:glycerol-3-phosphate dehydrogenase (NAD(P)+)
MHKNKVGVIGTGSFGIAIANLIALNSDVLMFSRNKKTVQDMITTRRGFGQSLAGRISLTNNPEELLSNCRLLFPMVPSSAFREMIQTLAPYLLPDHFIIHGTKGFDIHPHTKEVTRKEVHTMSEVIQQESCVVKIGCLSGPNLAIEIMNGQSTATVIGSKFKEVIDAGKSVLQSPLFHVFGTHDILGAEIAGALKNIIAIGSGILEAKGMGRNLQAMLITRGLTEMIYFGKAMGATVSAFLGTAGIGDLIATATSSDSRNFSFGYELGKGKTKEEITSEMPELAEGVNTLQVIHQLGKFYRLRTPIFDVIYKIVFDEFEIETAIRYLMTFPYDIDVDFL